MFPIPSATTTLANTLEVSQPVFDSFIPYGYMEIGVLVGALVIVFIILVFSGAMEKLRVYFAHKNSRKFDFSAQHNDSSATSSAIAEHNRFKKILRGGQKISRYD